MAGGVNVKMGVSGVAQFKQSINQARQNMKTLDAQLALTEKQYKATGDAETYMQQKTEQLKAKLEEQKAIAANAEKALQEMTERGVDKSSKAFQDMLRTLIQAKGDMLDTENAMGGLAEKADDAGNEVDTMNNQLKDIGKDVKVKNVTDALDKITAGMTNVIKKAWKMGEAIVDATLGAGNWADEIKTTSDMYKDTLNLFGGGADATETLQRMRKTANLIDTDVDAILNAQDKLRKNSEKQDKEAMGAWAYLGIDPNGKNPVDLFWETGEAIAALGDEEDKVAYAQKLFGKSWRELLPLFNAGRDEYEKTMQSWSVVENDQIDNLGKMDDQYQKLQGEWETFKYELLSTFSGPLTTGMEKITSLFEELNKYLDTPEGKAMLEQMGDTITQLINDLTNVSPADVINGLKGVVDGIKSGLEWIKDNKESVVGAVKAFIAVWAGLEGAKGVNTALQLFRGLGWGGGGGGGTTGGGGGFGNLFTGGGGGVGATAGGTVIAGTGLEVAGGIGAGLYMMLGALLIDAWVEHDKAIEEDQRKAAEEAARLVEQTQEFQEKGVNSEVMNAWDLMISPYMNTNDTGGDFFKSLIEHRKAWMEDGDAVMDTLAEALNDDTWDRMTEILDTLEAGGQIYDGSTREIYDEMREQVERMAEVANDLNDEGAKEISKAGAEIAGAAEVMKNLPKQTATAVHDVINGMNVVIDGNSLTSVVGQVMATWVDNT